MRKQFNPYYEIIMNKIDSNARVLDLGCGCGNPFIGTNFKLLVGLDVFSRKFDMPEYDLVIYFDMCKIGKLFSDNSFDVVTAIDVIEHLQKDEGIKIIEDAEKIARNKVIFFTPTIWSDNIENTKNINCWAYGNKYNKHQSLWKDEDFTKRGYKIEPCQEGYLLAIKCL